MSDAKPTKELLDNLDLLMNMSVLNDEKDWALLNDLKAIPPARVVKKIENEDHTSKELQNGH